MEADLLREAELQQNKKETKRKLKFFHQIHIHTCRCHCNLRLECIMRVSFILLAARPSGNLFCLGYVGLKLALGFLGLLIELLKNGFLSCSGPGIG
jgi:hypothetical protein